MSKLLERKPGHSFPAHVLEGFPALPTDPNLPKLEGHVCLNLIDMPADALYFLNVN